MKRILIFSLQYFPLVGGAEVAIKEITDRIPDIEFDMVTLRFDSNLPEVEQIGNVRVHRIGLARPNPNMANLRKFPLHLNKYLYQFTAARYASRLHRDNKYDAIWAMMAHSCAIPAGMFKAKHPDVPYLLTLQEGDPPEYIERMMRPVWPLFVQGFVLADQLQAISTFLLAWGKRMGFKGEGVLIPNAVSTDRFAHVDASEVEKVKNELGKKNGDIYLVTTSRLVPKNAVDVVIHAMLFMPEHTTFIICGVGPQEANLRSLAKELQVENRVRFLGHVEQQKLPALLHASDIFIRPSRSEGLGISFIEAMAAGLPVIATQEGGIADFLFDEKRNPDKEPTGWAVDTDSPEQIVQVVENILAHPEKVKEVTERAYHMVLKKYNWDAIAQQLHLVIESII